MVKYVIVLGGVISGVGKGIATASIGKILQEYGYSVTAMKIDPYINIDASLLRGTEHGESYVLASGKECDQDLGNYERFLNVELPPNNSVTTGQIYKSVIDKERDGFYKGKTVQLIPHITDEIKHRIVSANNNNYDIVMVEVGGTVGDLENRPFLYAIKSLETDIGKENIMYVLVTYMLIPSHLKEMKSKPTQQAIRCLLEDGIIPDMILCRGKDELDDIRKKKIETFVNMKREYIISAPDVDNIYKVPLCLEKENVGSKVLFKLGLVLRKTPDWALWNKLVVNMENPNKIIRIAMICKYSTLGNYQITDSYISVNDAIKSAGANLATKIEIEWINASELSEKNVSMLSKYSGIVVPGGFGGGDCVNGKILAIKFARENNIPFLGLCYGMQLAVVEFARNICGMKDAHTTEVNPDTHYPVVDLLENQKNIKSMGGTLRLGSYPAILKENSKIYDLYSKSNKMIAPGIVCERHRHRYEINSKYIDQLENSGLIFSGYHLNAQNNKLMEFLELPGHKFFIASQAHPEFSSSLLNPNPLFIGFIESCFT